MTAIARVKHEATGLDRIAEYVRERDAALTAMDLTWLRERLPPNTAEEVVLMTAHKTRYECVNIAPELRHESRKWLQERGLGRMNGFPFPFDDELPA